MQTGFLIVCDGPPDLPHPDLEQHTTLEAADAPVLKDLSRNGRICRTPLALPDLPRAEDTWRALLGVDLPASLPRGPLEAAALDVPLERRDLAFACPFVAGTPDALVGPAEGLTPADLDALDLALKPLWSPRLARFAEGNGAVLRWTDAAGRTLGTTAPDALNGRTLEQALPRGDGAQILTARIHDALEILDDHPVNRRRRGEGLAPVLTLWPWGGGTALALPDALPGRHACAVASDPGFLGLGRLCGLRPVAVAPAPDVEAACRLRADAAFAAAARGDSVIALHLRRDAPTLDGALAAVEALDRDLLGTLAQRCQRAGIRWRLWLVWNALPPEREALSLLAGSDPGPAQSLPFDRRGQSDTRLVQTPSTLLSGWLG